MCFTIVLEQKLFLMRISEADGLKMLRQQCMPCLAAHVEHVLVSCRLSTRVVSDANRHRSVDMVRYIVHDSIDPFYDIEYLI